MNIAVTVPAPGHAYSRIICEADNMMMILFVSCLVLFSSLVRME
jgi:hypothetical protein